MATIETLDETETEIKTGECADCGEEDKIDDDLGLSASAYGDRMLVCDDCEAARAEAERQANIRHYTIPEWMEIRAVNEGHVITHSYGIDLQDGIAIRCTRDASDRSESWDIADLSGDEMEALETWCAANGAPTVAGPWEPCAVTDRREK